MYKSKITYLKKLELFKELDDHQEGKFFAIIDQKVKNHLPQWIQFSPHVLWLKNPEEEKSFEFQSPLKVVGALTVLITFVAGIFPGIFSYLGEVSSIFFGN